MGYNLVKSLPADEIMGSLLGRFIMYRGDDNDDWKWGKVAMAGNSCSVNMTNPYNWKISLRFAKGDSGSRWSSELRNVILLPGNYGGDFSSRWILLTQQ